MRQTADEEQGPGYQNARICWQHSQKVNQTFPVTGEKSRIFITGSLFNLTKVKKYITLIVCYIGMNYPLTAHEKLFDGQQEWV